MILQAGGPTGSEAGARGIYYNIHYDFQRVPVKQFSQHF
jgi:hypothetical protein